MLNEKFDGLIGTTISYALIVTVTLLPLRLSYAQSDFDKAVSEANSLSIKLRNDRAVPTYDTNGNLLVDGKAYMNKDELIGKRSNDYLPASSDTYGSDAKTLLQGQAAQAKYEEKTLDTAETSAERAYHIVKKSFNTKKPDLTNDPMWSNTDNVLDNLSEIAKDFASCKVETKLVSTGKDYHVPKYEVCERLPAIEETFTIGHEYKVGVIKHKSGPVNMLPCGNGCMQVWIGTVGDNYWSGWCTVYEESMSVEVLQPNKITYAKLDRSKFDDYHQVYLNGKKIYNGPNGNFPPETEGACELSTSWDIRPNVNITSSFTNVAPHTEIQFKTRTSASGNGEGFSSLLIYYDQTDLVYDDVWYDQELIDKAIKVKSQLNDGYCTGSIRCTDMPSLDASGCTTVNGIKVCEHNFASNPVASLGISPFCRRVEVASNCGFNEGQVCFTDLNGVEKCFDNDTVERNQCEKYEQDPTCSYVKSDCVEGAEGVSGNCYVQEDTYDCGFTASTGTPTEEEVLTCDGQLQCIGENCYSPTRDGANGDFGQVNAYLEMLKYAKADMSCKGIPDAPYNAESPPDQYTPVPSCEAGFVYDDATKQCLKETGCVYSDDDFYAASPRNGIQVLVNNQVKVDDASIPTCVPVTQNGETFTCGVSKKKIATDTFYEVCTNEVSAVVPSGCPSASHIKNPKTGYCEVPPTPKCPDGVPLVEGDDPWSVADDKCLLEVPATPECNQANESYNPSTEMCESTVTAQPYCNSGTIVMDANGNVSMTTACRVSKQECRYDGNHYWYVMGNLGVWIIWGGKFVWGDIYTKGAMKRRNGTVEFWHEICRAEVTHESALCPSGFTPIGNQCVKTNSTSPTMTCPEQGTYYDSATNTCRREEPADRGCPSHYPVWDASEGRCKSKGPSPLASANKEQVDTQYSNAKELVELVLAPFDHMLDVLVPEVVANADLHGSEEAKATQETMTQYVASKFQTMAEEQAANKELVAEGQQQLLSQFSSSPQPMSSSPVPYASTTGGEANVTCELFKGQAAECKIAVGGMQNCCEAPTKPSLGDYISLTTKMLEMDALTGQVMGLDGYSGVWEIASDWASSSVESAWSAIQSEFISPSDVVSQVAKDSASDGIMNVVAQEMMQYTNTFLTETFGAEVAQMFLQEVGTDAAGNAVLGASEGLAAAGQALMYVYYAYLAYVVFNLLVGIIYECTDEELDLAMKKELLSTHKIGSYCASEVLGACIEKRHTYCVFDSPLSRIMMEQIYAQPQMGLSWGSTKQPNCTGLALDDMDKVNWDNVNLDEWVGILIETGNFIDMANVDIDSLTGAGSNLNYKEGGIDRSNVLEANKKRMENIDVDEVRRDAYEDAWNKNQ